MLHSPSSHLRLIGLGLTLVLKQIAKVMVFEMVGKGSLDAVAAVAAEKSQVRKIDSRVCSDRIV